MSTVLESIVEGVREDLAQRKREKSLSQLHDEIGARGATRDALGTLRANPFSVIAEVKRSSPSKGHLADIPEPDRLAAKYEAGGAAVISVLTERRRFNGSLKDLDQVRKAVDAAILRKDFMVDEYQFFEARAHGADVVLLIAASLSDGQLQEYSEIATELGLTTLLEVHDEDELERAFNVDAPLIGVNARNLKTLEVDLATCHRLLPLIPENVVAVAESGITRLQEVQALAQSGARAVLVGEALVKTGAPQETVQEWSEAGADARKEAGLT